MAGSTVKRRVFIGSSSEGLPYAEAVFSGLESRLEPSIWDQLFLPSRSTIEDLDHFADEFDFAVLILTPDDERKMRGELGRVPRDNVIFELGLFMGALGRERVFYLVPKNYPVKLPTDLLGVTALQYTPREDGNIEAAVRTACRRILSLIEPTNDRRHSSLLGFWDSVRSRHEMNRDARSMMGSVKERIFVSGITLNYVIEYCKVEIGNALDLGLPVEILIAANTDETKAMYRRYKSVIDYNLPLAHKQYEAFCATLTTHQAQYFNVYCTPLLMTHSVGLYDARLYISEFCLDAPSSDVPSYELAKEGGGYRTFIGEVRALLRAATPLFGSAASRIMDDL